VHEGERGGGSSPPRPLSAPGLIRRRGVRSGLPRLGVTEPNGRARKDAEGAAEGRAREGVARTVQAEEGRVAEEEDEVPVAHNRQPRLVSGRLSVHKLCPLALCGEWAHYVGSVHTEQRRRERRALAVAQSHRRADPEAVVIDSEHHLARRAHLRTLARGSPPAPGPRATRERWSPTSPARAAGAQSGHTRASSPARHQRRAAELPGASPAAAKTRRSAAAGWRGRAGRCRGRAGQEIPPHRGGRNGRRSCRRRRPSSQGRATR